MAAPQVGTVQDGYRFTGGNPADPNSWQRVAPAPPQKGAIAEGYRFTGGDPANPASWEQVEDTTALGVVKSAATNMIEPYMRFTRGALGGLKGITDFFGAGNAASEFLQGAQEGITEHVLSDRTQRIEQERAARAGNRGFWDTVKALPGELLEDPGMLADILGAAAPAVAAGALTAPEGGIGAAPVLASGLTGAIMGAGTVKGSIYDATKSEFQRAGASKEEAERAADEAQSYAGKNVDMIALGGVLGALAADTGIEPALARTVAGRVLGKSLGREATEGTLREGLETGVARAVGEEAAPQAAERGLLRATVSEAVPQGLAGGQQQLAQNLALQREGFDRDTWQGVGGAAAEQGILGGILGAGVRGAMKLGARGEEAPPAAKEPFAPEATETRANVMDRLQAAAGEELPAQARAAVKGVERAVSNAITEGTPEAIESATAYLDKVSGNRDAGKYHDVVADALERPVLDTEGKPTFDTTTGKPIYEGVLAEARRILDEQTTPVPEAEPIKETEPVKAAPEAEPIEEPEIDYDNHPLMQEHEAKYDSYIEGLDDLSHVNSVRKRVRDLIKDGVIDEGALDDINEAIHDEEPGYKLDAGIGALREAIENARDEARFDVEDEITQEAQEKAEAAAKPAEEVAAAPAAEAPAAVPEPEIKAAAEEPPVPSAEEIPLPTGEKRPTEMKVVPNWMVNFVDQFGQAPELDAWVKSNLGYDVLPSELETASQLNRLQTKQAGGERLLQRNHFDPIVGKAASLGVPLEDIGMYLWANEAIERNPEIAQRNENFPEGGAGLTTAQAKEVIQNFKDEGTLPKLKQLAQDVYKLRDHTLEMQHKAGLITDEDFKFYRDNRKNYVPLKGFAAEGDIMTADLPEEMPHTEAKRAEAMRAMAVASPTGRVNEFRKAMGRGSMPFHPMFNLFNDAEQAVRRIARMEAAQPILRAYKVDPSAFDGVMHVYTDKNPKQMEVSRTTLGGTYEPVADMAREYRSNPDRYLMVKDKGVPHYIEFADTDAGNAVKRMFFNMSPEQMHNGMRMLAKTNNFMKGLLTFKNPLYLTTVAPFRDITDAIATAVLNQNIEGGPVFKKNLALGVVKHIANPSTWATVRQFVRTNKEMTGELGGLMNDFVGEGGTPLHKRFLDAQEKADSAAQALRKLQRGGKFTPRAIKDGVSHWVDGLADIVDMVPRFATYRAAVELGVTLSKAADLALDSSLNLTRRGELSRAVDLAVPFFGANIEGSRKVVRIMRNPRAATKIVGALIAYGVAESMLNSFMSGDNNGDGEQDYLDLDRGAGLRMSRAVLFYGHGPDDYVKIPIGQMLGYFKFVGNKIGDLMVGNSTPVEASVKTMEAGKELLGGLVSLMAPMRVAGGDLPAVMTALTPLIGKPFVENAFNRNFFGSPIYSESFPGGAPRSELGRATTADVWKSIARAVNSATGGSTAVSGKFDYQPEIYRHMVESYLGGPYQLAKQFAGLPEAEGAADIPGIKSFVGTGAKYSPQSKYFDNSATIRQIMGRMHSMTPEQASMQLSKYATDTDPRVIDAFRAVESSLDHINKEQKATIAQMQGGGYSAKERQNVLDHYLTEKNKYYDAFNAVYHAAKVGR